MTRLIATSELGDLLERKESMTQILTVRVARPEDVAKLHPVIERAYRGDSARQGWTHEADLLSGERTDDATLAAMIGDPDQMLLIAEAGDAPVGCVSLAARGDGLVYLGLLCVDPTRQAAGIGKAIIVAAEKTAREQLDADRIEMTVIDSRTELIAYYERRGFVRTGERRAFPIELDPPLGMVVLEKVLA
jgi:ribosomal protein S18 acetylase RimI-like enzyme